MSRCQKILIRQLTKKMGKTGHLEYFAPRVSLQGRNARSTRYFTSRTGAGATRALKGEDKLLLTRHGRARSTMRRKYRRTTGLRAARQRTVKTDPFWWYGKR